MEYTIKPWYKRRWFFLLIGALFLFFVSVEFFFLIGLLKNNSGPADRIDQLKKNQAAPSQAPVKFYTDDNYWLGSDKAEIIVVEFGDFTCPYCRQAFFTVGEIRSEYKDDIKFIWRDYPIISDYSVYLSLAGRCAGEQGLFWPMHDKLFQNQGVGQTDDQAEQARQLTELANQIGADAAKFNDCLSTQKYLAAIQKDLADGEQLKLTGTPTYFINNTRVEGDMPYETFKNIIEQYKAN